MAECRGNDDERALDFSIRADNFEADKSGFTEPATDRTAGRSQARRARLESPPPKSRSTQLDSEATSTRGRGEVSDADEPESV